MPHYWIVNPDARAIECFRAEDGAYKLDAAGTHSDSVAVPAFDGLTLALGGLWLE